jgi:UDP-N-acetylmuramate: L-alanyl-gamma-D-glutamyl-meso-diaminopimelate ligase
MTQTRNEIPAHVKKIHLIAICGTAMGALACMLKDLGFEVRGSDQKVYPPMSRFLSDRQIAVSEGFDEENLVWEPDLVVVGNAVTRNNPEAVAVERRGLAFCSMPQAINAFVAAGKDVLVVCGTHGKTTTASILAWVLHTAGFDPSFVIGGILKNFNSNYRLGNGPHIVIEGDEYDTAFFDKGPKFLHYRPQLGILTSVEFDHADIYTDLGHVVRAFQSFLGTMSPQSTLFAFHSDEQVTGLVSQAGCRIQSYGLSPEADWQLGARRIEAPWTSFDVNRSGKLFGVFKTQLMGEHNLLNALAVIGLAHQLHIPAETIGAALETFEGVKRRQEIRGQKRQIIVMDDFAHHPTAVKETIRAVKSVHDSNRLIAVFEPRTNSSMRKVFQDAYTRSFDQADHICIRKPPLLEKIPPGDRFSSERLVADLRQRGRDAYFFENTEAIIEFVAASARPGDLILIMSNGGFDNIHERLLQRL